MLQWNLPSPVSALMTRLEQAGFATYLVGGCLRDGLLGKQPTDWDLATAALPAQVQALFDHARVIETGLQHGTVTVILDGVQMEVTTFRKDGVYADHRRPEQVTFTASIEEDLARRDFTVNAMAYSPTRGLIDPFGGQADLQKKILRAVGDPTRRFEEDALRILRLVRFCAVLGFEAEPGTATAALAQAHLLAHIAAERILQELEKLLMGAYAVSALRQFTPVITRVLPELAPSVGFDQNNYHHSYDVWEHTLHAMEACAPDRLVRWALLLHDCGKPHCYTVDFRGDGHFYGHAAISTRLSERALDRLRMDKRSREEILALIYHHDHDLFATDQSLRRWLHRLGEETLRRLLLVKRADNKGQAPKYDRTAEYDRAEAALDALLVREDCFSLQHLAINGTDVMALGYTGPAVGKALHRALEAVLSGICENTRDALLAYLQME